MLTRSWFGTLAAVATLAATAGPAWGQAPADQAAVIVEGTVRDFYKGAVAGQNNALVQLEASRTEMGRRAADARRLPIPAPGDPVYVHLATTTGKMPRLGATIRAFLAPRSGGGWQGVGDDWFQSDGGPPVIVPTPRPEPETVPESAPAAQGSSGKTILKELGVKADPVEVNGRLVLKVAEALAEKLFASAARDVEVRDAAWKVEMNAKRIETTKAARQLAEQRLDAEQKRYEVGMSTSFLVIQAQRDLAQSRQNELASVLSYDLSLVDFEALQQAGPSAVAAPAAATQSAQTR